MSSRHYLSFTAVLVAASCAPLQFVFIARLSWQLHQLNLWPFLRVVLEFTLVPLCKFGSRSFPNDLPLIVSSTSSGLLIFLDIKLHFPTKLPDDPSCAPPSSKWEPTAVVLCVSHSWFCPCYFKASRYNCKVIVVKNNCYKIIHVLKLAGHNLFLINLLHSVSVICRCISNRKQKILVHVLL